MTDASGFATTTLGPTYWGERLGTRTLSGYGIKPELAENVWTFVRAAADAADAR